MTLRPRKRFGQHFLHDPAVIGRIVDALDPQPGQTLVEIGPGRGALTFPVLERSGSLDVIEIDRDLAQRLRAIEDLPGTLTVHACDALTFDFGSLAGGGEPVRVFGNLPYNISTPLLFRLLQQATQISDMLFMLQREVVDRMTATPGNKTYGRLTVMLAASARAEKLFRVGRGAFTPPPQVESAIVRVIPRTQTLDADVDPHFFSRLVNQAFSHRRKTLRNALSGLATAEQIAAAGIDPSRRPETVDPEGFVRITRSATAPGLLK